MTSAVAYRWLCIGDAIANDPHLVMQAACKSCGRVRAVDWLTLGLVLGADYPIAALARRIRCTACGVRGQAGWLVSSTAALSPPCG